MGVRLTNVVIKYAGLNVDVWLSYEKYYVNDESLLKKYSKENYRGPGK